MAQRTRFPWTHVACKGAASRGVPAGGAQLALLCRGVVICARSRPITRVAPRRRVAEVRRGVVREAVGARVSTRRAILRELGARARHTATLHRPDAQGEGVPLRRRDGGTLGTHLTVRHTGAVMSGRARVVSHGSGVGIV